MRKIISFFFCFSFFPINGRSQKGGKDKWNKITKKRKRKGKYLPPLKEKVLSFFVELIVH